jgi:hypothetical protein
MIMQFGSLYAGHVDLENIGPEGTPVNERWLSDTHLATAGDLRARGDIDVQKSGQGLTSADTWDERIGKKGCPAMPGWERPLSSCHDAV